MTKKRNLPHKSRRMAANIVVSLSPDQHIEVGRQISRAAASARKATTVRPTVDDIKADPKFSGWMFTDAMRFMDCAKCDAKAGAPCRTPKGRKSREPHGERTRALVSKYTSAPWTREATPEQQARINAIRGFYGTVTALEAKTTGRAND